MLCAEPHGKPMSLHFNTLRFMRLCTLALLGLGFAGADQAAALRPGGQLKALFDDHWEWTLCADCWRARGNTLTTRPIRSASAE